MRYLLAAILVAALGWSGYWLIGAHLTETGVTGWLETRQAEGWVAEYEDVTTRGFPNRFDTTIARPSLADPATGLAWSAEFVQFLSLSYRPHRLIAVLPDAQTISTPFQTVTLGAEDLRASLILSPDRSMTLRRTTIEGQDLSLASTLGWDMRARHMILALRQTPERPLSYDMALTFTDVTPPALLTRLLGRTGLAGNGLGAAQAEGSVTFDAPWDLAALEDRRPQPRHVRLSRSRIGWGEMVLQAQGAFDVDEAGRPDGEVTVRATNWRGMLQVAGESGALNPDLARLVESGLNLLARAGGDENAIDVPLRLRNGQMTLGGVIPLGPAPVFLLR